MAEGKNSFILYLDMIHAVRKLPDDKAGILLKTILAYVNDENPIIDDLMVELVWEPIKQGLKRNLKKWDQEQIKNSESGQMGNLKRWHPEIYAQVLSGAIKLHDAKVLAKSKKVIAPRSPKSQTIAVSVSDSVSVSVIKNNIDDRKLKFSDTLQPYLQKYGKDMLNDFYRYWTEPNKSKTKFRQEMEKTWDLSRRLETWSRNSFGSKKDFGPEQTTQPTQTSLTLGKQS